MATQAQPAWRGSGPGGTVVFLFSDIEGSTARWEHAGEAMSSALARHDRVLRASIEAHGGYIFKTVGDAFCAAFATAGSAVAAAIAAQRRLGSEDFSGVGGLAVRMALHAGSAEQRDGDYFGSTVNRVARLLSAAHGGQVIVSGACAELLQAEMPAECGLRDLGKHRLKDLAQPEHVYQIVARGLPEAFPPLRSLDNLSNNLPAQLTSFVGRDAVVSEIKSLVQAHRLVTLVGAGGAGKTRGAIQVGAELVDGSGDGVWIAELASISDPSLVSRVIARSLGVPEEPNRPILETLLAHLKRKRALLIVDNCEHVIEEARRVIAAILHACPELFVLATSREALNIEGEQLYRMPSLSTPPPGDAAVAQPHALLQFGAPALFVDRAAAVDGHFRLTNDNAPHIVEICRRLDGIPLAIELAAARVKVLSPQQLASRLNERFRLLTGGDRNALPRHQPMRALIDWSYGLLQENERVLFRKLSIFTGTFDLESAAAVCCDAELDEMVVLDLLASLVDKSLVQTESAATGTRYRLLESTRQYARELLAQHGEYDVVARAHATAFLMKAEELDRAYESIRDDVWGDRVEPEMDNCRSALEWSLTRRNDVAIAQRLAGAMRWIWMFFAPGEGLKWVRSAREAAGGSALDGIIAKLDLAAAELHITMSQYHDSYSASLSAFTWYEHIADLRHAAEAGWALGRSCVFTGRAPAGEAYLTVALERARKLGLRKLTCWILPAFAQSRKDNGDLDAAALFEEEALHLARSTGFQRMATVLVAMLAELKYHRGEAETAVQLAREAIAAARMRNDRRTTIVALSNLAAYCVHLSRYTDAREAAREALLLGIDSGATIQVCFSLQHLAAVAAFGSKDRVRAAQLIGYADAQLSSLQGSREYTEQSQYDTLLSGLRDAIDERQLTELMREGAAWTGDEAIEQALVV